MFPFAIGLLAGSLISLLIELGYRFAGVKPNTEIVCEKGKEVKRQQPFVFFASWASLLVMIITGVIFTIAASFF